MVKLRSRFLNMAIGSNDMLNESAKARSATLESVPAVITASLLLTARRELQDQAHNLAWELPAVDVIGMLGFCRYSAVGLPREPGLYLRFSSCPCAPDACATAIPAQFLDTDAQLP